MQRAHRLVFHGPNALAILLSIDGCLSPVGDPYLEPTSAAKGDGGFTLWPERRANGRLLVSLHLPARFMASR